ncbi:unnamed protein product, partial [Adineta steineri]
MASNNERSDDITLVPTNTGAEQRKDSHWNDDKLSGLPTKKKGNAAKAFMNFLYNPEKKTVLGRDSLNWAKLSAFYTVFYFFLGCFFVGLVYIFASILDRVEPRYHNTESAMAVRSTSAVVGMGFRPQPIVDDSLIHISNDPSQQERIGSSLRLFRDVFLVQSSEAKTEECSEKEPASELPYGTACLFNWSHIVKSADHPCSDDNLFGFKNEQPCVLVKLNKVYGWAPIKGVLPSNIQKLRGVSSSKSTTNSDVYITCTGTHAADSDVITSTTYYSLGYPDGSDKFGVIPNYFFPFRNAKDHVQPFVLVQFNKLPLDRLVSITCRAWAPGIEHNVRGMRVGIHYWQILIGIPCTSSLAEAPIQRKSSFYDHFQYRTKKTCKNESSNLFLTIAILSSYERLLFYLPSILNTWILTTTNEIEIIIFIEENSFETEESLENLFLQLNQQIKSCLFIVKLKHVENTYPPQKKSFYAMKFIYTFYQQRTFWLLRLDDNAYVNIEKLVPWLKSIDHRQALYIGQSGSGRRNGPSIHFPSEQYFCMGGSGVILSQQTLIELGPWLDQCLNKEIRTIHEDVELGRCILTHVHISCLKAYDSKYFFYHHYGSRYLFGYDFTPLILSRAFIIHPIKDQKTFYQIFTFYIRKKQENQRLQNNSSLKISMNKEYYITFLAKTEFNLARDIHYQLIDARWKLYIENIVQSYVENTRLIWYRQSCNCTLINGKFIFGYYRLIPSYGLELIVEILLNTRLISMSSTGSNTIRKRLRIRQPFINKHHFEYREIIPIKKNESIYQLNLVVVSSNKDTTLLRLIENFEREVLKYPNRHQYFTLTILYFYQKNQTINQIYEHIHQLSIKYTSVIRLSIINQNQINYNRGLGRHLASKLFTNKQLLFFLDVDLIFTGQALDNIRQLMIHQLSISSCTVYFPIIFSYFSSMFNVNNRTVIDIDSNVGSFSIYGYGNVVVRKQDLDRIGGWEINNHEWGNEDVNLFQRFSESSSECNVFRTVEPGLKHYYHKKMCNGIVNRERQKICYDADGVLLGSQRNM